VVVFPHAGAGPYGLRGLVDLMPPAVSVLAVTLPGREDRESEPYATEPAAVVDGVVAALAGRAPVTVVGISAGALLALRTVAALRDRCDGAVLAAQTPGQHRRWALEARGEAELARVARAGGEVPAALLADDDIRDSLFARLAADLRLGARAAEAFDEVVVDVPLTVVGGLDDPLADATLLARWDRHTRAGCAVLLLTGGHLAFLDPAHRPLVAGALAHRAGPPSYREGTWSFLSGNHR
jgi:surfactin synthase thioesterase subunit